MDTMEEKRQLNDKFMLRLPDGMRDRIKAAAADSNRSMNSEILATLDEKYPAPKEQFIRSPEANAALEDLANSVNNFFGSEISPDEFEAARALVLMRVQRVRTLLKPDSDTK